MRKFKILILTLVLICTIGITTATDINISNLKAPDTFSVADDDAFFSADKMIEINIDDVELDDLHENDDADDNPFKNSTIAKYSVVPGRINNTFNFTDGTTNIIGCVELVKIENQNCIVTVWTNSGDNKTLINDTTNCLKEFNELNDLKPIDTTTL